MTEKRETQLSAVITTCMVCLFITVLLALASYDKGYWDGYESGEFWGRDEAVKNVIKNQRIDVYKDKIIIEYNGETFTRYK